MWSLFFFYLRLFASRASGSVVHVDQGKLPVIVRLASGLEVSKKASLVPNS
jgi:hypothetical protein